MHDPMRCSGAGYPMGHGGGHQMMGVPLIPAPVAFFAMLFGVMIGVMIGKKRSTMHGMSGMSGMGGMMSGGSCGGDDWAMRKKMRKKMIKKMAAHHHHGDGMPSCGCGEESASEAREGAPEE